MTIKIEIEVPSELVLKGSGAEYLDRAAGALGFARAVSSVSQTALVSAQNKPRAGEPGNSAYDMEGPSETPVTEGQLLQDKPAMDESGQSADFGALAEAPKRERGKPSPGKARRTKEEIAEDEAADAADAAKQQAAEEANLTDDVKPAISTGEERIGPEDVQDAADEAAETEKTGLAPIDVLRRLVGDYQKKHGMPAAVKLCQEGGLIGKPIHELDDAGIEAAIAAMRGAFPTEPDASEQAFHNADTASQEAHGLNNKPIALAPKTKADLVEAMMRYADKYDGTRDQAKMTHTLADMPKVFIETFGEGVDKLSKVPEDKYAEAVAAVEAAIEADPYGRAK